MPVATILDKKVIKSLRIFTGNIFAMTKKLKQPKHTQYDTRNTYTSKLRRLTFYRSTLNEKPE